MKHRKTNKASGKIWMQRQLILYEQYLIEEERSPATVEKYTRIVRGFLHFAEDAEGNEETGRETTRDGRFAHEGDRGIKVGRSCSFLPGKDHSQGARTVSREMICAYKQHLLEEGKSPSTINTDLAAIRSFLRFIGASDIRVRNMRLQKSPYVSEKRMLEKGEYEKLIEEARNRGKIKLQLILESICATGIRVSELSYITVEAVEKGEAQVSLKGKTRTILIPHKLGKKLLRFAKVNHIYEGPVFVNNNGDPIHRSYVWAMMKKLAKVAGVDEAKAFPHNLRRLFARSFYRAKKDIAKLADVLGHSSIDTTRIYIAESAREHARLIDRLQLVT